MKCWITSSSVGAINSFATLLGFSGLEGGKSSPELLSFLPPLGGSFFVFFSVLYSSLGGMGELSWKGAPKGYPKGVPKGCRKGGIFCIPLCTPFIEYVDLLPLPLPCLHSIRPAWTNLFRADLNTFTDTPTSDDTFVSLRVQLSSQPKRFAIFSK